MVNHVRTLLLNLPPALLPGPGEEYVPRDFRPVLLPPGLAAARDALFGPGADRTSINLTLARILGWAHASATLATWIVYDDARLTYDPARPCTAWPVVGESVTTLTGLAPVGYQGAATFGSATRSYASWVLSYDGAGHAAVAVDGSPPQLLTPAAGGIAGTVVLPLIGSNLALLVPTGVAGGWAASLLVPPAYDFTAALDYTGAGLFAPSGNPADAALAAVGVDGATAADRAAALALALARRIGAVGGSA